MATAFRSASSLKRVRGLGAAHTGVHHWWLQRATAAGNLLLLVWFAASLLFLPDLGYGTVRAWIAEPAVAIPLLLLTLSTVWHMRLGVQVMIEDYVRRPATRLLALLLLNIWAVGIAASALFAIARIAFGAADA
ncbi:succinate dehydrogenase, hydrophobic membrane anchor protein [Thermaurantiacus sp.]